MNSKKNRNSQLLQLKPVLRYHLWSYYLLPDNTKTYTPDTTMGEARGYVHHKPPSAAAVWDEQYVNCSEHWGEVW